MEWNGKKETDSLLPGEVLKIQKPANLENQKTVSKNTKLNLVSVESSKPNLRFPLKNRTPIQNHFTKLSFAPHKGILFKATRHAEVRNNFV